MNERIKELVGQAKFMAEETINKKISANDELNAFAEKFAELIIGECTNRLEQEFIPEDDIIEGYNDSWDSALRFGAKDIKQHFGVEE